ncbi:unnamed protein product [Brugia timori]|uniref:Lipoprotein n=1 Tax=Brugia timori TaxID=42155 RepID=A0A0R3QPD2_9BILA|nr:unnamed protein product [Brugia timori]
MGGCIGSSSAPLPASASASASDLNPNSLGVSPAVPGPGACRFAHSRSSPGGDGLAAAFRIPDASGCAANQICLRQMRALAARRFRIAPVRACLGLPST